MLAWEIDRERCHLLPTFLFYCDSSELTGFCITVGTFGRFLFPFPVRSFVKWERIISRDRFWFWAKIFILQEEITWVFIVTVTCLTGRRKKVRVWGSCCRWVWVCIWNKNFSIQFLLIFPLKSDFKSIWNIIVA